MRQREPLISDHGTLLPLLLFLSSRCPSVQELPFFILFTAGLCSCTALLAMLTHQFPEPMGFVAKTILSWMFSPIAYIFERVEDVFVNNLLQQLSRV